MPQISASIHKDSIIAVNELAKETPYPHLSFSSMVDMLILTHPKVSKKIQEISSRKNPKQSKK